MRKRQKLSRSTCEDEAEALCLRAQWLAGAGIRADARPTAVGKAVIVACMGCKKNTYTNQAVGEQAVASNAMKGCREAV